jgi:tight adherence protein B
MARDHARDYRRMTILVIALLLALLGLGSLVLYLDAKRRRIERQLAIILPDSSAAAAPVTVRVYQENTDWRSNLLRTLLNYERDTPRQGLFAAIGLLAGALAGFAMRSLLPVWLMPVVGLIVGLFVIRSLFGWQRYRYTDTLMRQLPDTLEIIVNAVRAGLPIIEACRAVTREIPEPTRQQFVMVLADAAAGRTAGEALRNVYLRTRLPEYAMFSVTLAVQSKSGGRLAETLNTLNDTVRKRVSLAGRAKALAGEAKLSANVLAGLPFAAGGLMYFTNPGSLSPLFTGSRGNILLAVGLTTLTIGVMTMRWMIKKGTTV